MLGVEELTALEDELRAELNERLEEILSRLNRSGQLEELLEILGLESLLHRESAYCVPNTGKIVVIGQSEVKADILLTVAGKLGLDKKRFELYLEYEDAKKFNFRKMQYNPGYCAVLVGPMPHSGTAKGEYSSMIAAIELESGYPPVVRLGLNSLKISKSDFKKKLNELMASEKIA